MPFLEMDRLPTFIERGARGGPKFKTTVKALFSGHEKRFADWADVRGEWDVGYGLHFLEDPTNGLRQVIELFYAVRGRADGFRFKDWIDFEIVDQQIGLGDGAMKVFQIVKLYQTLSGSYARVISKPVPGTTQVFKNGALQASPVDYSLDTTTGKITFVIAPGGAGSGGNGPGGEDVISVTTQFDIPVRFDIDQLEVSAEVADGQAEAGTIPSIRIVELKP